MKTAHFLTAITTLLLVTQQTYASTSETTASASTSELSSRVGFNFDLGLNQSLVGKSFSMPYINIGWFM